MEESDKHRDQRLLRRLHHLLFFFVIVTFITFLYFSGRPFSNAAGAASAIPSPGGAAWEKRVRASAMPRPLPGSQRRRALSVLVTGAAGFIGAHASAALRRRGDGVLGLDRFDSSYERFLKRTRQALLLRAGVFVVEGDLSDPALLRKLLEVAPFTHVLHLAGLPAAAPLHHLDPAAFASADAIALMTLLEAVRAAPPPPTSHCLGLLRLRLRPQHDLQPCRRV